MTDSFYSIKKLMHGLGLPVEKIHCCINGCMIYWSEDIELISCKLYNHPRYKRQDIMDLIGRKQMFLIRRCITFRSFLVCKDYMHLKPPLMT